MCTQAEVSHLQTSLYRRRVGRVFMYVALAVSGFVTLVVPNDLITDQLPQFAAYAWSFGLIVSSVGCLVGTLTDRWIGEFSALPLLTVTLVLYGFGALFDDEHEPVVLILGLITLSFAGGLTARWRDVQSVRSASLETTRGTRGSR